MTMLARSDTLFCYDGSLEGFLSLVFRAYALHLFPCDIQANDSVQPALGQAIVDVETEYALAERVRIGISNKAGYKVYRCVEKAFRSDERGREMKIFSYIVLAMAGGRKAVADLSSPVVESVERLARKTDNEAEYVRQFARFELVDNGVYAAVINPCCDVLPLVIGHFVERYNVQPFLIYDEVHHLAAVYDKSRVSFVSTGDIQIPPLGSGEFEYQRLWKTFYDSISNEQRFNPDIRRGHMPKRFWKNLTEFKAAL